VEIKTNSIFTEVFRDGINNFLNQHYELPAALNEIVNKGFREAHDCILLEEGVYFSPPKLETDFDKCSFEDFFNHIHIDHYVNEPDEFEYLRIGVEFGRRLYVKLKELFSKKFRVTISYSNTTYDGEEIEVYGGCVVRFHTVRESCDAKFLIENLDVYETEAVVTFEG